jgi:CRP/FNR family transcriptional regulator, cyclic AMP receptor protein
METDAPFGVERRRSTSSDCKWSMALEGLTRQQSDLVLGRLHRKQYGPRSRIFTFGDKADALLIVESGRIRTFHSSEAGEEFTTAIWSAGHAVGLISTLLDQTWIVSVESVEHAIISVLSRRDVFDLMTIIPNFAINMTLLVASVARYSLAITGALTLDSAEVRLSKALAGMALPDSDDGSNKGMIVRGLNQEDLATMIGVSRTWLTLMLSSLERRGLIWRKRRQIGIYDLDALRNFCHGRMGHQLLS